MFIVFEGPEGGGKTTQLGRLADRLAASGRTVVRTREPGGTGLGDRVRSLLLDIGDYTVMPETEVLLLAAARAQHVREVIRPALERSETVLCDRFVDSTYAYQGGGHGLSMTDLRAVQRFATGGLQPDVRLLLDVPVSIGLARRLADPGSVNRIDRADRAFHQAVRDSYLSLAAQAPDEWIVIDATGDPEAVGQSIDRAVDAFLESNVPAVPFT